VAREPIAALGPGRHSVSGPNGRTGRYLCVIASASLTQRLRSTPHSAGSVASVGSVGVALTLAGALEVVLAIAVVVDTVDDDDALDALDATVRRKPLHNIAVTGQEPMGSAEPEPAEGPAQRPAVVVHVPGDDCGDQEQCDQTKHSGAFTVLR